MRRGLWLAAGLAMGGCTRDNDAFDGGDGAETMSSTEQPTAPDDTGTSMGSGEVTSMGPTAGSGDCEVFVEELVPEADTFVVTSPEPWCNGNPCSLVNYGHALEGVIEDSGWDFRAYMLMTFKLSQVPDPIAGYTASLAIEMKNDLPVVVGVFQVRPVVWGEGNGNGNTPAQEGHASWQWSANPMPWVVGMDSGNFGTVLANRTGVGMQNVPGGEGTHTVVIPLEDVALDGNTLHLAITKVAPMDDIEALVLSRESPNAPTLLIEGC